MINPEIPHIINAGIIQTIQIDKLQIEDYETIQTKDQTITIITIDHVTIPEIEILLIQIDRDIIFSLHREIIYNIKIHNKTIEVVHLNFKDKLIRYRQKKLNQTLPVLTKKKIRISIKQHTL